MKDKAKTGSSRRRGDEYQDLTALCLALELYIEGAPFELFIEYEKAGNLDDIVVQRPQQIDAYQVKHAVDPHSTYGGNDFLDAQANVFFGKFAKSWQQLVSSHPGVPITVHLRTNRHLDSDLAQIVDADGHFDDKFQQGRYRKDKGRYREALKVATSLASPEFLQFIASFRFDVGHPSWKELERHIQAVLLDHQLGISDRQVFAELKSLIERHAIELHSPITFDVLDSILRESQSRFLLSQRFAVEEQRFVEPPTLGGQLDDTLAAVDGDYIVVTGPPGSGKSTALTKYFDALDGSDQYHVVRYYCFVRIDDNQQRLRLEAQSLRANLLDLLYSFFPDFLARRFDMSESHFLSSLERLGTHCQSEGKKLVVFVDGLDHAERDDTVLNDVVQALPAQVPAGVVFVVGTQELRRWTPLALQRGREHRHIQMPLFSYRETELYFRTRCQLTLSDAAIQQVQEKSSGLPLYLRYIAELMAAAEDPEDVVQSLPATVEGDIRQYYEMLWNAFDAAGRGHAKYLSFVLALLRFRVHRSELYDFQRGIPSRGDFDEAYRQVGHLLRDQDGLIGIFHNSFRAFVLDHTDLGVRQEIVTAISTRLKQEECSPRWYRHALTYAAEAKDGKYVLSHVNREFVDQALLHNRDSDTIEDAIMCGIAVAAAECDCVQLSKLGSLRHRTNERLEYQFAWLTRAETLLYLGRVDDVLPEFYAENSQSLVISRGFASQIILWLKELGKDSLAETLFRDVLNSREEPDALSKESTVALARCAGIFPTRFARVMRWLANRTFSRDILEPPGFEPVYAPHLDAYLNGVVSSKPERFWERIARLDQPFSNQALRYYLIRAVAEHKPATLLAREIADYVRRYPSETNVELAFLATKAQMPAAIVQQLAGQFSMPKETVDDHARRGDLQRQTREFAYWAAILGYAPNGDVARPVRERLRGDNSVWAATLGHLLLVGQLLGAHRSNDSVDWFGMAIQSVERLKTASHAAYEQTPDALVAARSILPDSLRWASEVIAERCPERVNEWMAALVGLRASFIWTTHYGINESRQDYSFEFPIWREQAQFGAMRHNLKPVLTSCAASYARSSLLKGGARGDHFLELSAIAARCGFRDNAEEWLREGVNGTLSYGYRKDDTLMRLADVLRRVNRHRPEKAFSRSAAVLEMIKWMHHVSDGAITQEFPQEFFPVVLDADRPAALDLLRFYYERFGRWQANDCTKTYILSCKSGDPEYLWALASLLHPNESLKCRQHIAGLPAVSSSSTGHSVSLSERLVHYIVTSMNPALWPEDMKARAFPQAAQRSDSAQGGWLGGQKPTYLDGVAVAEDQVIGLCKQSVSAMIETLDKLRAQNDHVSDHRIVDAAVPFHIDSARTDGELAQIETLVEARDVYARASYFARLGSRYIETGNLSRGTALLEKAFRDSVSTTTVESCIAVLAGFDRGTARRVCLEGIRDSLEASYSGQNTPCIAAAACEVFGEIENLDQVFDDFLVHCQELFRHLPSECWFDWLTQYVPRERNENEQIAGILIDQLAEPEIELGRRLMAGLCELCCERSSAAQIVAEEVLQAEGLQQGRLLQVLHAVAYRRPESIRQNAQALGSLLDRKNAAIKLLVRDMLRAAFRGTETPKEVVATLDQVDRNYSSVISHRMFRIVHADASSQFRELLERAALLDFRRQLEGCCDVLSLEVDQMIGHLERRFTEKGGSVDAEIEEYKDDWDGYVHLQGWPRKWIVPRFHVKITKLLGEVLDEILCKTRVHPRTVESIWRILQPSDPLYVAGSPFARPSDVLSLVVTDEGQWLGELETREQRIVLPDVQGDWVNVFEYRELAQAGAHDVDYRSKTLVRAALFRPEHLADGDDESEIGFEHAIVAAHPYESLTWDQFQQAIMDATHIQPDEEIAVWPIASIARSPRAFVGFPSLASLCPYIIDDYDLEFRDFVTVHGENSVARYEVWREGWFSSDYGDEPMAFGCRLRVHAGFLRRVCTRYQRAFVLRADETRESYESYKSRPVRSEENTTYTVVPFNLNVRP